MTALAPIALFVYNRPEHARRTIDCLKQNTLAEESDLFIFSDAPKTAGDIRKVEEVRAVIGQLSGFRRIEIIKQEKNKGLANSIIDGVTFLVNKYGKIIVMEDDLESSPYLLQYFNDALNFYQDNKQVMHIGAYMYPINAAGLPETFFFRVATSWGWATWQNSWSEFESDVTVLMKQFGKQEIDEFSFCRKENFWKQLQDLGAGKNNSWAIRWYASIFLKKGLVLSPSISLTNNIGNDATGTHSGVVDDMYKTGIRNTPIEYFPGVAEENKEAYNRIIRFYEIRKGTYFQRIVRFLKTKHKKILS